MNKKEQALIEFAKFCLWQGGDWCGGIDGEEMQDKAEELGLIEPYTATEPCCDYCMCAEIDADFPVTCYRYTDLMKDTSTIQGHGTG
jgi:hypothetical protein